MVIRTIKKFVVFLRKYQLSTFILILLDIGVLWAAAFLALKARFWPVIDLVNSSGALVHPQLVFLMFYALICVFVFQANGLYRPGVFIYLASQQVLIVKSILWSTLGLVLLSFLARWPVYIIDSRLTIFYFFIFSVVLASFFRLLFFPQRLFMAGARQNFTAARGNRGRRTERPAGGRRHSHGCGP